MFIGLSLALIVLGFFRPEHTELSLIGFFFLFLLSFTLMGNNLEINSGYNKTISYDNFTNITTEHLVYNYEKYNDTTSKFNTHSSGYYLAVMAAVGFIGVFLSLRRTRWNES